MSIEDHSGQGPLEPGPASPREPLVRAPLPALALAASFLILYGVQSLVFGDAAITRFGFSPADLAQGRVAGLVTGLFVHGGWAHAFLNALGGLAFGTPVARLCGRGARGTAAFLTFFLVCGALSSLGYAFLHWGEPTLLVGASGGVSGFMGATSRLMGPGPGLARFASRPVLSMAGAWIFVNLVAATVGLGDVTGGAPIAWEAHLAGYATGLLLIGPSLRLLWRV
ncbi:MAG TPA: rhomboid family intramembrane serine protease [Caulobacteraceae bacterium]|jgi:membrane associated rhomboid family serine protease|nr:rhomboid family intramembrane serine protease [Caulobacteraceae bacterium]